MLPAMANVSWASKSWTVEELEVGTLLDFIRASEVALVFAGVFGFAPSGLVVERLSQQRADIRVGSITPTSLVRAPKAVREFLGPQLRAHGISDLWLPSGYYLFFRGELIGYRDPGVPKTFGEYLPTIIVGGLAVIERLATKRWGNFTRLLPRAVGVTVSIDPAVYLASQLRDAVSGSRGSARDRKEKERPRGAGTSTGRGPSPGPRTTHRTTRGEDDLPPEPWPKDPYEVLGLTSRATNDEIKRAYRRATSRFHPDKAKDESERHARDAWQKHLNLAYGTLREARGF